MYLHFQDWSEPLLLERLSKVGPLRGDKIIKVFASEADPRQALGRSALTVLESPGLPFEESENFSYKRRRAYGGGELESKLAEYALGNHGQHVVRSLFRFSHEYGFTQAAMSAKINNQQWLIKHPFENIHGIGIAASNSKHERLIHLDIFFADSLAELKQVVNVNYDKPEALLPKRDGTAWLLDQPIPEEV